MPYGLFLQPSKNLVDFYASARAFYRFDNGIDAKESAWAAVKSLPLPQSTLDRGTSGEELRAPPRYWLCSVGQADGHPRLSCRSLSTLSTRVDLGGILLNRSTMRAPVTSIQTATEAPASEGACRKREGHSSGPGPRRCHPTINSNAVSVRVHSVAAVSRRTVVSSFATVLLCGAEPSLAELEAPSSIQEAYDGYARSYDQLDGGEAASLFGLPNLRRELLQKASGRVLEVGVGTGLNLPLYNLSKVQTLEAVDLSPGMLEKAKIKASELGAAEVMHFRQADVVDLPFEDQSFDAVVDTFSLCVYADPGKALAEMRRVTRPGGKVLLLAHSRSNLAPLAAYQDVTAAAVTSMGKGCVWNQDVEGLLSTAGLEILSEERHLAGLLSLVVAQPRG